jgi:metallophosphoesterase (TIGR00282 family)
MRILFLGDIVGKVGRNCVAAVLPTLREQHSPDFVIANAENSAAGLGVTQAIAEQLFSWDIDAITLGNHAFHKREIESYLNSGKPIVRPGNFPPGTPGKGWTVVEKNGMSLAIANFCGRVFMSEYEDPFRMADKFVEETPGCCRLIDFHAEATSEKIAFGYYMAGRASAVLGTHTHVQTADERILEGGTAYISDIGMCGPENSVIGMDKEVILRRFLTLLPEKFEVAGGSGVICGALVNVESTTGAAESIERVQIRGIR